MSQKFDKWNQFTVVLFKDHLVSRTFQVPFRLVSKIGILLSLCIFVTLMTSAVAIKFYKISKKLNPVKITELESEIQQLKLSQESETRLHEKTGDSTAPSASDTFLFTAFPEGITTLSPNIPPPISLMGAEHHWEGNTLDVKFSIQYNAKDNGNQQGRIILLARGPETLLTYPQNVFNTPDKKSLISPTSGEYFSVSRFRLVEANFQTTGKNQNIDDIEVLVFSRTGVLLIHEVINIHPHAQPNPKEHS